MKIPNRYAVSRLDALPNVGKILAGEFKRIGIDHPRKLIGKNPLKLYESLCLKKEVGVDYCVIDVFMSVVDFMEGEEPKVWWEYTAKRKRMLEDHPINIVI